MTIFSPNLPVSTSEQSVWTIRHRGQQEAEQKQDFFSLQHHHLVLRNTRYDCYGKSYCWFSIHRDMLDYFIDFDQSDVSASDGTAAFPLLHPLHGRLRTRSLLHRPHPLQGQTQ